jgi:hypothetical protein
MIAICKSKHPPMKKYSLLSLLIFLVTIHAGSNPFPEKTVVSVLDTDYYYELRATFQEEKHEELKKAIDKSIQPEKLFGQSITRYDADITLNDGTHFHLKISDTKIVIKFSKKTNSAAAYERMKTIFEAAKKALNDSK